MISGWLRTLLRSPRQGGRVDTHDGLLARLRRDVRGNTLAIGAAALIPLAGMVGGGIDMSRMYITKTRLQHACDAGALAGRKAMGSGAWSQASYAPRTRANEFFDANYGSGSYGSTDLTRTYTESAGTVSGTATATLPMTLMRVLGKTTETITVTCETEMRLPNTDVMFVLDTTGSMGDTPAGDSMTKMDSLKVAVKCFYEIVARLDSNATCTTGTPSGGTGNQVQIRFGFVPYATNVNVGRLLNTAWVADSWSYQTRKLIAGGTGTTYGEFSGETSRLCALVPAATAVLDVVSTQTGSIFGIPICSYKTRPIYVGVPATWQYGYLSQNIAGLKNGSNWNASFEAQVGNAGAQRTINWDGCIEERATVRQSSYTPIPAGAKDLDIDQVPNSADTRWGAALPDLIFTRQGTGSGTSTANWNNAPVASATADYTNTSYYACPTAASKLRTWPVASEFDAYVDSLTPEGNTYHDIGLLWGGRLASGTGIFASENALTPRGGEIERHVIFMTDGDACAQPSDYNAYGVPWFDRRQTDANTVPTGGCTETGTLTQQVNVRTEAICTAIKNKNITLWVITFGNMATTTETRMQNCATSGRYFKATNAATLQQTFKSIADQISQLRLTK